MYADQHNLGGLTPCFLFQSCAEGEEEEEEEGKEKTFEVLLISQEYCSASHFGLESYSEVALTALSFRAGKGNGEAKDAVPASQAS